jgi:hypothetical protein
MRSAGGRANAVLAPGGLGFRTQTSPDPVSRPPRPCPVPQRRPGSLTEPNPKPYASIGFSDHPQRLESTQAP